jgi:AraC-like DNA-binding protein
MNRVSHQEDPALGQKIRGFGRWQEFVNFNFPWLEMVADQRQDFRAQVRMRSFGERSVATIGSDNCRVSRTDLSARRAEAGHIKMLWQLSGKMTVQQDGRCTPLLAGDVSVCDTGRPYRLWLAEEAQLAVLTMPYNAVPGWERLSQKLCGSALADRTTARAALAAILALLDDVGQQNAGSANPVLQAVQWMLSASLHRSVTAPGERASAAIKLDAAHQHILAHIDDPALSPEELAGALHVSRRALYLMFKEYQITPGRFIHKIRLDAVRDALSGTENSHRSILEIALDHGFTDSASFSRIFKAAFGLSPSAWRSRVGVGGSQPARH